MNKPHAVHTPARRVLTAQEVSEMTGIPTGTLRYWRSRNEGLRSFKLGRRVVYDQDDLEAWLDAQRGATSRGQVTA